MARQILNDGENKGIFRGKLNSNFSELYTDVSDMKSEATDMWNILNDVDSRSRENESRIESLEEHGIGSGATIQLPWCLGYFQSMSFAANIYANPVPIVTDGDASLVEGVNFTAPSNGKYALSIGSSTLTISTTSTATIVTDLGYRIATGVATSTNITGSLQIEYLLQAKEYLIHRLRTYDGASTLTSYAPGSHFFLFRQIS